MVIEANVTKGHMFKSHPYFTISSEIFSVMYEEGMCCIFTPSKYAMQYHKDGVIQKTE